MAVEIRFCDGTAGSGVKKKRIFSALQGCTSKNNGFFLRCRVARPKIMDFFCAAGLQVKKRWPVFCTAGLQVKKRWPFSAPQGCMSKNDGRFLRRRVASQETVARFLRRRVASQETVVRFLRRRFVPIKNRFPQQVRSISVLKIFSFAHFFLHLPTSFLNNKHQ